MIFLLPPCLPSMQTIKCSLVVLLFPQIFATYRNTRTCGNGYYKACDLLGHDDNSNNDNVERQECEFRCSCDGDGCEVALIDRTDEDVPICEISYN